MRIRILKPGEANTVLLSGYEFDVLRLYGMGSTLVLDHPDRDRWPDGYILGTDTRYEVVSADRPTRELVDHVKTLEARLAETEAVRALAVKNAEEHLGRAIRAEALVADNAVTLKRAVDDRNVHIALAHKDARDALYQRERAVRAEANVAAMEASLSTALEETAAVRNSLAGLRHYANGEPGHVPVSSIAIEVRDKILALRALAAKSMGLTMPVSDLGIGVGGVTTFKSMPAGLTHEEAEFVRALARHYAVPLGVDSGYEAARAAAKRALGGSL